MGGSRCGHSVAPTESKKNWKPQRPSHLHHHQYTTPVSGIALHCRILPISYWRNKTADVIAGEFETSRTHQIRGEGTKQRAGRASTEVVCVSIQMSQLPNECKTIKTFTRFLHNRKKRVLWPLGLFVSFSGHICEGVHTQTLISAWTKKTYLKGKISEWWSQVRPLQFDYSEQTWNPNKNWWNWWKNLALERSKLRVTETPFGCL